MKFGFSRSRLKLREWFLVFPLPVPNTGNAFLLLPFPSQNAKNDSRSCLDDDDENNDDDDNDDDDDDDDDNYNNYDTNDDDNEDYDGDDSIDNKYRNQLCPLKFYQFPSLPGWEGVQHLREEPSHAPPGHQPSDAALSNVGGFRILQDSAERQN